MKASAFKVPAAKRLISLCALAVFASAATTALAQSRSDARKACAADFRTVCSGTKPGGGKIIRCLNDNRDKLSEACKAVLDKRRGA